MILRRRGPAIVWDQVGLSRPRHAVRRCGCRRPGARFVAMHAALATNWGSKDRFRRFHPTRYVLAMLAAGAILAPAVAWGAGDEMLQKVVIVSRHGVRTPEISAAEQNLWSSRPWPVWTEPPGALTARGAQLAKLLGQYYRAYAVSEQLLPEQGCPPRGSVLVYADVGRSGRSPPPRRCSTGWRPAAALPTAASRTQPSTACSIRSRLACAGSTHWPRRPRSCRAWPATSTACRWISRHRSTRCRPAWIAASPRCARRSASRKGCKLASLPTVLSPLPNGKGIEMLGALAIASTVTENFPARVRRRQGRGPGCVGALEPGADAAERSGCTPRRST